MSELLEIVLEDIKFNDFFEAFKSLIRFMSTDSELINGDSKYQINNVTVDLLTEIFSEADNHIFTIESNYLLCGTIELPSVMFRFLKYNGTKYDIDFNFDMHQIPTKELETLTDELHKFISNTFSKFDIKNVFFGLEPANDEDTRFFTNNHFGPLTLPLKLSVK